MTHNKKTPLAKGIGGAKGDQYHKDYPNTLPNRKEDKPMTYYNTDDLLQQHKSSKLRVPVRQLEKARTTQEADVINTSTSHKEQ